MIHATDKEKCEEIIGNIAKEIECNDYRTAYSVKEYKKKRIKYFTEK
ncbi:unnamed protein product [marine sediment metagenome]|uniref:Siroheme decarboxylase AsnC-like ligand binding domain-containing protein n=1 Tax=marine sediment metagenome TaxID=412755 RepID=X1NRS6_9ZZZZ